MFGDVVCRMLKIGKREEKMISKILIKKWIKKWEDEVYDILEYEKDIPKWVIGTKLKSGKIVFDCYEIVKNIEISDTKFLETLLKEYNGFLFRYYSEYSFYFKNKKDATRAKEWIESMIIMNKIIE